MESKLLLVFSLPGILPGILEKCIGVLGNKVDFIFCFELASLLSCRSWCCIFNCPERNECCCQERCFLTVVLLVCPNTTDMNVSYPMHCLGCQLGNKLGRENSIEGIPKSGWCVGMSVRHLHIGN